MPTYSDSQRSLIVFLTCCVAAIGGFLFGFDSGVINGTVDGLQSSFNSDSVGTGFNVASMLLGCAVGAFFAGRLADKYGRRTLLLVAAVFFIVSAWGSGIAGGSLEFVIYRILGGLAVGAASVMAPAYISEIAPAHLRGRLATIQQVAIISGLFFSFLNNYILANLAGGSTSELWFGVTAWRWMFWMELIPAGIFLIALLFIPESPRYLVSARRDERAERVLHMIYNESDAKERLAQIRDSLSEQRKPRFSDLINPKTGKVLSLVWVGIGLAVFQQLVGINVVFYYGAVLWQAVGFSEGDALLINVISGAVSIAACLGAIALIDRIGRKPLLWGGSLGMAVTLAILVYAFSTAEMVDGSLQLSDSNGVLALIAANAYVFFFNSSWGPVMWVMLGEMFPNQVRGSGLAIAGLFQWVANFAITMTFPIMLASIGLTGAYGFYAICAVISIFFVIKFVRETNGRELEDMAYV
ncbi:MULTISPECIES: sugar porter family MFS transporter [Chromohalobacter]|uniref:D-xylose-proton symporter n=1 Tax=Chromohalobacter israelensis (strain ATCC BAA-138 / DSM 3043 / CIP 106854 / NCIMB 13768 / 1H11) TaxID=290398 RepID=Q1QWS8_CHRI1|nr:MULTISPECIES: sugar porter family MFS transporter [Chromohalobacter]ABE59080.1 Sugar transporter [Chromohalobacter salexigens DSM 3043]MDF9435199.1 sugar porter family MFS transporter [Chromohalobacter israelensis]MDO0946752.1 sugar porter family MFS transporter [Chromohalobacter salexigens]NQY44309.1 sugar porter family MFS transporter [Chromohalobacter sp.]NWO57360.1 MFS transporter [Chromohalobacter salexigens]